MPPVNAATIAGLLLLALLLPPTAFGASLLLPRAAVSHLTALGPRDEASARSDLPDAVAEGRTASPIAGEAGAGPSAAVGCAAGQGTGSRHDTAFWRDVPDTAHDPAFGHTVPDTAHDRGWVVEACDRWDPACGIPVAGPPSPRLASQAIEP